MAGGQSLVGREMCPSWLSSPAATSPDTTRMGTMGGGRPRALPLDLPVLAWEGRASRGPAPRGPGRLCPSRAWSAQAGAPSLSRRPAGEGVGRTESLGLLAANYDT